jgi:hypothetical protein
MAEQHIKRFSVFWGQFLRDLVFVLVLVVACFGSVPHSISEEADIEIWMNSHYEPWQEELDNLWPDVKKMIAIAWPHAESGSVKAKLIVGYLVHSVDGLPDDTQIAGMQLHKARVRAVEWVTEVSKENDPETAKVAKELLALLKAQ